jgi:hypothetical protein
LLFVICTERAREKQAMIGMQYVPPANSERHVNHKKRKKKKKTKREEERTSGRRRTE